MKHPNTLIDELKHDVAFLMFVLTFELWSALKLIISCVVDHSLNLHLCSVYVLFLVGK